MRGKRLSKWTMNHAKLDMPIECYPDDMQRRGCTEDPVNTNQRAHGLLSLAVDLNSPPVTL